MKHRFIKIKVYVIWIEKKGGIKMIDKIIAFLTISSAIFLLSLSHVKLEPGSIEMNILTVLFFIGAYLLFDITRSLSIKLR